MDEISLKRPEVKRQQTRRTRSELDAVVEIPWQSGMVPGSGRAAITGCKRRRAVEPFAIAPVSDGTTTVTTRMDVIANETDALKLIDTRAGSSFNLYCVDYGFDSELIAQTRCSRKEISIVVQRRVEFAECLPGSYRLNADAAAISDPVQWRHVFGDYFIAGYRKSALFYAIYHCKAENLSDIELFTAKVKAARSDVFDGDAAAALSKLAVSCNIDVECTVVMNGVPDGSSTHSDVPQERVETLMGQFTRIATGVPSQAILWHYSRLGDVLAPTLDIAPAVLSGLKDLYCKTRSATVLIGGFPPREPGTQCRYTELEQHFDTLRYEIQFRLDEMIGNEDLLNHQLSEVNDWLHDTRVVMSYQDLQDRCANWIASHDGHESGTEGGQANEWIGGVTRYPQNPGVVIEKVLDESFKRDYETLETQQHTFRYHDVDHVVVGYQVLANWQDGTCGSWEKTSGGILENALSIRVRSLGSRGTSWTVRIFAVRAADFRFD